MMTLNAAGTAVHYVNLVPAHGEMTSLRYFAYIHGKKLQLAVTDEDGVHEAPVTNLPESTSIRQTAITKLRELGYYPCSKWSDFSDYSFAEVQKVRGN